MQREFTSVIEKRGNWYIGYVEELPGVNTQRKTLKEVRENLKEALCLIIQANRDLAIKSQAHILSKDSSLRSE
jgi:predicted RNase H-like HicB family nuclease